MSTNYYLSLQRFPGDGVTTLFSVNFAGAAPDNGQGTAPYLDLRHIHVNVISPAVGDQPATVTPVEWEAVGPTTFRIQRPVPEGHILEISRNTPRERALVDYRTLQVVSERDLDTANRQLLYILQEALDRSTLAAEVSGNSAGVDTWARQMVGELREGITSTVDSHNHSVSSHPELRSSIVSEVSSSVIAVADRAQREADRAEAARDAAFVSADVYPSVAEGRAAVADGEQFIVVQDDYLVRYVRINAGVSNEVARMATSEYVARLERSVLLTGIDFEKSRNLLNPDAVSEYTVVGQDGVEAPSENFHTTGYIAVEGSADYAVYGSGGSPVFAYVAYYDRKFNYLIRLGISSLTTFNTRADAAYMRLVFSAWQPMDRMVTRGTTPPLEYIPYGIRIEGLQIPELGEDSVSTETIQDGAVTPDKASFIRVSPNLFDRETALEGKIINPQGELVDSEVYWLSEFIPASPGTTYGSWGDMASPYVPFVNASFWDENKQFIRRVGFTGDPRQVVAPPGTRFMRVDFNGDTDARRMLFVGSVVPEYEPPGAYLVGINAPGSGGGSVVDTANIRDRAVTPAKTTFISTSYNLYDAASILEGKVVNPSGQVVDSQYYRLSQHIRVKPSTLYSTWGGGGQRPFVNISEWARDGTFLGRSTINESHTTGPDAYTVRLDWQGPLGVAPFDRMFVEGDTPQEFSPYGVYLDGVTMSPEDFRAGQLGEDAPMVDVDISGFYSTDDTYDDLPDFRTMTATDVYALWDSLAATHPTYISKEVVGQDVLGDDIPLYRLVPERPVNQVGTLRRPRMFIISGIHGGEDVSGMASYTLAEAMCNRWQTSEVLEALRFNVEFLIMPVVNPSGWDLRTRKNANGVDINSNFPDDWVARDPSAVNYGGTEPMSEPETQCIAQVMADNPGIDAFFDFHNFGPGGASQGQANPFLWIPSVPGKYTSHLGECLIQKMTRHWRQKFDFIPDDPSWFAGYTSVTLGGQSKGYAHFTMGIDLAYTMEWCSVWQLEPGTPFYSVAHKQAVVESCVNWLVLNVKEIVRRG